MASVSSINSYFISNYSLYSGYVIFSVGVSSSIPLRFYFNYGSNTSLHYENTHKDEDIIYEDSADEFFNSIFTFLRSNYKLKNSQPLSLLGVAFDLKILHDSHLVIGSKIGDTRDDYIFFSYSDSNLSSFLGKSYVVDNRFSGGFTFTAKYGNIESGKISIPMLKYSSSLGLCFQWVTSVNCIPYSYDPPFENDYSAIYSMGTEYIILKFNPFPSTCCLAQCFGITE